MFCNLSKLNNIIFWNLKAFYLQNLIQFSVFRYLRCDSCLDKFFCYINRFVWKSKRRNPFFIFFRKI
nr:MAG TPA: hypothetical protein [Caudoviricetes sp.]